jgi:aldehyde dehydrogenase (NAD+)/betaine-aldehyde dehydrogenase
MAATTAHTAPEVLEHLLIDGRRVEGEGEDVVVLNPATEERVATIAGASYAQVDAAVAAARRAADEGPWPRMAPAERSAGLHRFCDAFERRIPELLATIVTEVGTPVQLAEPLQVGSALTHFRNYAELAARDLTRDLGPDATPPSHSELVYRPAGVAVGVTAYNYPLMLAASKIGAAMAAGCTTVLLPSPRTPLTSLVLGELALEAELPPGVLNVIVGGPAIGEAATRRADVDRVSFTGSVQVGQAIMRQCVDHVTGVVLELGGKSPAIVLPGLELDEQSVGQIHLRYMRNAGQGCASPTRILVPENRYDEFLEISRRVFATVPIGDPWDPATVVGPLIRPEHRDRVEGFVDRAVAGGATVLAGGGRPDLDRGWYVNPTLVGDVAPDAEIAQEEIFGPIAVLFAYRDLDHAVELANSTKFGLAAYLHGPDLEEARAMAGRLRAGSVYINGGGGIRPDAPFGGWGASSVGREWGAEGIREYLEPQHIQWRTT